MQYPSNLFMNIRNWTSDLMTAPSSDECFQDEKLTVKQNGSFVNSEKLECINEPELPMAQQSRKRSKNTVEAQGEKVDDHAPCKLAKVEQGRLKFAARNALLEEQSSALLQNLAANSEQDQKLHKLLTSPVRSIKKPANTGAKSENSSYPGISNNDASISPLNSKDAEKYRSVTIHSSDIGNTTNFVATHQKYQEKNSCKQLESPVRKSMTHNNEEGVSTKVEQKEKRATCGELPDLNLPVYPVQQEKSPVQSKDVSNSRPKGTMLERAIRELEKVVAESRLSTMEVQDMDASSAATKRRLPREVKQKLAKVARLAQSSHGKISEELINRLMNILGHSMQLRTLKRNLREMVLLGLSAKREKADRFQQMKMEITEMIKLQAAKQRDVATGDLPEVLGSEEQVVLKEQYSMDNDMEDKICDLYDLYVQGMDEDKGPQIRKLYVELAELWPNGIMDKHGIKSAIHRAKERKRALCEYDKVTRKKSAQKMEVGVRGDASSISQLQVVQERHTSESSSHILALPCRASSCKETLDQHLADPLEISSLPLKGCSLDIYEEKVEKITIPMLKEQMKQQQQQRRELKNRVKKLSLKLEKGSGKSHKQDIGPPDAASYELAAPPSCGHPV
ncbi:hypothetical protein PTKIN_Ptkin08bG0099800 [Pterospermum kingtungense]